MTVANNKKTVMRFLEAMRVSKIATCRDIMAEDMIARIPRSGQSVLGNQHLVRGADEILKMRAAIREGYFAEEMQFNIKVLLGEGDFIAAFVEMATASSAGDNYANEYVFLFKFRDQKTAEWDAFMDTARVYQQFGYKISRG